MRQTVAKRIRRQVYGDYADARKYMRMKSGQIILSPECRRRLFQLTKEAYLRG